MSLHAIAPSRQSLADYKELLKRVRATIAAGKERALEAVERESVRTKWEVGKLIQEHILLNKARAEYGRRVIERLSGDLGISKSELNRIVEFGGNRGQVTRSFGTGNLSPVSTARKSRPAKGRGPNELWSVS